MERIVEKVLFASRWLLAPVYLGMSLILIALGVKFFMGIYEVAIGLVHEQESALVLQLLSLIDLVLVASLIVMVMFSGYENFVSRMDTGSDETLGWLGKLDAGTLKLKVAASIVAISSIHLLEKFMQVSTISGDKLMWYVIIHLTFVVSALLMGVLDRIAFAAHREH